MSKKPGFAISLPLAFLALQPALAEPLTHEVATHDLDLSTSAGVAELEARLRSSSRRLCREATTRERGDMFTYSACRHRAMAEAAQQMETAVAEARLQHGSPTGIAGGE